MTEAEAYELVLISSANSVTSFTVYITVTFGYLAVAYVAGNKLSTPQMLIVSALYLFSALSALLNFMSDLGFYETAMSYAPDVMPEGAVHSAEFWRFYMFLLLAAGIVASLYFMWSSRRSRGAA